MKMDQNLHTESDVLMAEYEKFSGTMTSGKDLAGRVIGGTEPVAMSLSVLKS
jgi:hypothetical protein